MKNFIFALTLYSLLWISDAGPLSRYYSSDTDEAVHEFSYNPNNEYSPEHWYEIAPECGGDSQSPINIQTTTVINNVNSPPIMGTKWGKKARSIKIENNGHTVKFEFFYANEEMPVIQVNGDVYEFVQLHFHFGYNGKSGSEHTINKIAYAMEGHAVFFNRKYGTFTEAQLQKDGLTVVGRFYNENYFWSDININFNFLHSVQNPEEIHVLNKGSDLFSLQDIMGDLNLPYYTYSGSLTTPGCNEIVTWVVGSKPLEIWSQSLLEFRKIIGHEGLMAKNFRPVQEVNGRPIHYQK